MSEQREAIAQVIANNRAVDNWQVLPCDYELADTILALPQGPVGWRDISTAPKDGAQFLSMQDDWGPFVTWRDDTRNYPWRFLDRDNEFNGFRDGEHGPTAWMPLPAAPGQPEQPTTDVTILTMQLSGNRQEHYVRITCDGRTMDVRKYDGQYLNRAEYERDMLRHVLLGEPKPDLMADKYADPEPYIVPPPEPDTLGGFAPDEEQQMQMAMEQDRAPNEQPSVAEAARDTMYRELQNYKQLDELLCCSGFDSYGQVACGCQGVTLRDEIVNRLSCSLTQEAE